LKRLETVSAPVESPRRVHLVGAKTDQERDAAIADLVAAGTAEPGDLFIFLVPGRPERTSAMLDNYRWDETAGHWVHKDGRDDAAIARLSACGR
jgi:hypothetical protein